MPSLLTDDSFTTSAAKISTTSRSLFAVALHALSLCVFLVVVVALLLLAPAAVVILLPVACMAACVCLLCATTARLLAPSVPPPRPGRARENRGGVRDERKQDCVEADRDEAPAGGFDDGWGFSAEEERGKQEQGGSFSSSSFDVEFSGSWDGDDEQGRFFFVDTSSYYCRTFYDLLAFWRNMEKRATRGDRNAQYIR